MEFINKDLIVIAQATNQGIGNSLRLFEDLLEHEVREATLLCSSCIPGNLIFARSNCLAIKINNLNRLWRNRDDFILAKFDRTLGVIDKGGNI